MAFRNGKETARQSGGGERLLIGVDSRNVGEEEEAKVWIGVVMKWDNLFLGGIEAIWE